MAVKVDFEPKLYYRTVKNGVGFTKIQSGKTVFNIESTFGEKSVYDVLLNLALKNMDKNSDTELNL